MLKNATNIHIFTALISYAMPYILSFSNEAYFPELANHDVEGKNEHEELLNLNPSFLKDSLNENSIRWKCAGIHECR